MTTINKGDRYIIDGMAGEVTHVDRKGRGYTIQWLSDEGRIIVFSRAKFLKVAVKA